MGELSHELCRKQRRGCAMQVPLQGLWAVGYCWNVNWNVLVVFWLWCSRILLSVCSVGFSHQRFRTYQRRHRRPRTRQLHRVKRTWGNDHGSGEFVVGKGFLSMQTLENVALIWNVLFFRIQENHSFNRQSPGFLANPRRGCC